MAVYFLLCGILIGISFVPTYACAILAGWAFGFVIGWPLAMVTISVASLLAYVIGRWVARDRVHEVIQGNAKANAIYRSLLGTRSGRTMLVVALLRVPPASPFALANFVLAAARVPIFEYAIGTLIGIVPRTAMATFAAAGLEQLQFKNVSATWMVVAGIVATIVVCVVLGVLSKRALRQMSVEAHSGRF